MSYSGDNNCNRCNIFRGETIAGDCGSDDKDDAGFNVDKEMYRDKKRGGGKNTIWDDI